MISCSWSAHKGVLGSSQQSSTGPASQLADLVSMVDRGIAGRRMLAFCPCHPTPPPASELHPWPATRTKALSCHPYPSIRLAKTGFRAWFPC